MKSNNNGVMIISFDLDNTLIPYSNEFKVTEINFLYKFLGAEPLRQGTAQLFTNLLERNHEIWIYTTSFRSKLKLYFTFRAIGILPSRFINGDVNNKVLRRNNCSLSKNPNLFGIDVHIDDSEGVRIEGERNDFNPIIVKPSDENWAITILNQLDSGNWK